MLSGGVMDNEQKVFAFDLGTGSLGTCIREGKEISHLSVDLLPFDYAVVKDARIKRRQIRTRIAHKKREDWWKEQAKQAGIDIPETGHLDVNGSFINPDPKMSREFPENGDNTIYNSALLRIALLQGENLEGWQIFKAVWSAIQHRGYDINLPWKKSPERNIDEETNKDEKENSEAVNKYNEELERIFKDKKEFYYPCYYEAFKMGIWSPEDPKNLNKKLTNNPKPARNKRGKVDIVIPRYLVEKEIKDMLIQAGKKYPYLYKNLAYVLYGPGESPYAAYSKKEFKKYLGKDWEWQGLLSQKTPRFDNRIISKCVLIPRLNVCKAKDMLNKEVIFLMKLKNIRYFKIDGGEEKFLTHQEINDIFKKFKSKLYIGVRDWKKYLKEELDSIPNPSQTKIEASKVEGRSRFCRPALRIIKEIILSGKSPHTLYEELIGKNKNENPKKGLIKNDYAFLLNMPKEWEKFHIPDHRMDDTKLNKGKKLLEIDRILSKISNPVVRHRLGIFYAKLKELEKSYGEPDKIILEFVRNSEESFAGEKRKKQYIKMQNDNKKEKDDAFKDANELGLKGKEAVLKVQLYREQSGFDIYDGKPIKNTEIENYEIDHIVPREMCGPDSYINKVLTSKKNNSDKGKQTPYEWLKGTDKWPDFINRLEKSKLSEKKKDLLSSENAQELVNKYTQLAETAYISKISQKICHLFFGWPELTEGSERKVIVSNGGLTAKMRRRYNLDKILYSDDEEYKDYLKSGKIESKNRDNPRHHALDAMVISMIPEIEMDKTTKKDIFPEWFNKDYCKEELDKCFPKNIRYPKPILAETIYGLRKIEGTDKYVFVTRFVGDVKSIEGYYDINTAKKYLNKIFSPKIRKDFTEKLNQNPTETDWKKYLDNYFAGGKPKTILIKDSLEIKEKDIKDFLDGKIKNYGEFIKGKMPGQYLKQKKESYGYIVYKNEEEEWIREPIYAFNSIYEKEKEIKSRHKEACYFRTGMLVEISNDCEGVFYQIEKDGKGRRKGQKSIKTVIKKGKYYLTTINNNNSCEIKKVDGSMKFASNLDDLMEKGLMKPVS